MEELEAADKGSSGDKETGTSAQYQDIVVTDEAGARTIMLNRPQKYNAITLKVYSLFLHWTTPLVVYLHCLPKPSYGTNSVYLLYPNTDTIIH